MRVLAWPGPDYQQQPYIFQLYAHLAAQGVEATGFHPSRLYEKPFDIWHMHWPENRLIDPRSYWAGMMAGRLIAEMLVAKARGTKIIWTVHNLSQHEKRHPHMEPWFWRALTRLIDGWIALSPSGKALAEAKFPALRNKPSFIVPLGHYREHYKDEVTRDEARQQLGISPSARVIASVGHVRAYKNVPHLVRTFSQLPGDDLVLLVAGRVKDAWIRDAIHEAAGDDPRVQLRLEFIPDDDVALYMRASDLVALPYTDVLNSSSALLALTFDVPVLVPTRGAMQDLQGYAGASWVQTFAGELSAADLARAVDWSEQPRPPLDLSDLNWDRLAGLTMAAYQTVLENVPVQRPLPTPVRLPRMAESARAKPGSPQQSYPLTAEKQRPKTTRRKPWQGPRA